MNRNDPDYQTKRVPRVRPWLVLWLGFLAALYYASALAVVVVDRALDTRPPSSPLYLALRAYRDISTPVLMVGTPLVLLGTAMVCRVAWRQRRYSHGSLVFWFIFAAAAFLLYLAMAVPEVHR